MGELRTPLATLLTQILDQSKSSQSDPSSADVIEDLVRLVDDITELAALETDKKTLALDSFNLAAAVESVVSLTKETLKARDWRLDVSCPKSIGWLVGDEQRIRLLLYHMIFGALRGYSAGGGNAVTRTLIRQNVR